MTLSEMWEKWELLWPQIGWKNYLSYKYECINSVCSRNKDQMFELDIYLDQPEH